MRVNIGRAKTELSRLIALAEAGDTVEIARDGVPVVRLQRIEPAQRPGHLFFAAEGSLAGQLRIGEDFEFTETELDQLVDDHP